MISSKQWSAFIAVCLIAVNSVGTLHAEQHDRTYAKEIAEAEERGTLIYKKDIAAARATDHFITRQDFLSNRSLRGWVTETLGENKFRVSFLGGEVGDWRVYFSVEVKRGRLVRKSEVVVADGVPASDEQSSMMAARMLAASGDFQSCAKTYNTVVLNNEDGSHYVYLLAATTDAAEIVIGRHYRIHISADGSEILENKRFSNSCLVMRKPENAVGMFVTHLLTPYPEETHVFLTKLHRLSLYVATTQNSAMWSIEDGKIDYVRQLGD